MTPDPATEDIEALLSQRLQPAGLRWTLELVARNPSHGGTLVYAAASADRSQKVAVKMFRQPERASAEVEANAAARDGAVPVPAHLLIDAEKGLIVTRWIEGPTLHEALATDGWARGLEQAGRWLRRFHARPRLRPSVHRPSALLVKLCDTAAVLPGDRSPAERNAFQQAVTNVARGIAAGHQSLYRPVRLHGDFLPGNLILSDDGLVGLDLALSRSGPPEWDLAKMLVNLDVLSETEAVPGGFRPDAGREALLSGYGSLGRRARDWLEPCEALELLRCWRVNSRRRVCQAARTLLARKGWLVALLAVLSEAPGAPGASSGASAHPSASLSVA